MCLSKRCATSTCRLLADILFQIAYKITSSIHPFDDSRWTHPDISCYGSYRQNTLPSPCPLDLPATRLALDERIYFSIFLTEQVDIADMYQGVCLLHYVSFLLRRSFIRVIRMTPYSITFCSQDLSKPFHSLLSHSNLMKMAPFHAITTTIRII